MLVLFDNVVTSLNDRKSRERSAQKHDQKRKADVFDLLNQSSIEMKEELKRFKLNGINEYQDVDATPVHLNFNHKTP